MMGYFHHTFHHTVGRPPTSAHRPNGAARRRGAYPPNVGTIFAQLPWDTNTIFDHHSGNFVPGGEASRWVDMPLEICIIGDMDRHPTQKPLATPDLDECSNFEQSAGPPPPSRIERLWGKGLRGHAAQMTEMLRGAGDEDEA